MKISAVNNDLVLEEVFCGILLRTKEGKEFSICMRDGGFEFQYAGQSYEAKRGYVELIDINTEKRLPECKAAEVRNG